MNNKNINENFVTGVVQREGKKFVIVGALFLCRPAGGRTGGFYSIARDLRGPGLRAYFWPAPKVGKNALRKLRFLRTFLITGVICFAPKAWSGLV